MVHAEQIEQLTSGLTEGIPREAGAMNASRRYRRQSTIPRPPPRSLHEASHLGGG